MHCVEAIFLPVEDQSGKMECAVRDNIPPCSQGQRYSLEGGIDNDDDDRLHCHKYSKAATKYFSCRPLVVLAVCRASR